MIMMFLSPRLLRIVLRNYVCITRFLIAMESFALLRMTTGCVHRYELSTLTA